MNTQLRHVLVSILMSASLGCATTPDPSENNQNDVSPGASQESDTDEPATTETDTSPLTWTEERDVAYAPPPGVGNEFATLDLYRVEDEVARPLVLLVHGGSWVGGDKDGFSTHAPDLIEWWLERGYTAACLNFRLASRLGQPQTVRPRDQARDIAHALAWLLQQEDYNLKQDDVIALGYSSGAHLVALIGADGSLLEEAGLSETVLAATVSLDVHAYDVPYALELMVDSDVEQNMPLIRHLFGDTSTEQLASSPISYLDGFVAPALVVSVDEDPAQAGSHGYIVSKTAERYVTALQEAGHMGEAFHDANEDHASLVTGFGLPGDLVTERVQDFLDNL